MPSKVCIYLLSELYCVHCTPSFNDIMLTPFTHNIKSDNSFYSHLIGEMQGCNVCVRACMNNPEGVSRDKKQMFPQTVR